MVSAEFKRTLKDIATRALRYEDLDLQAKALSVIPEHLLSAPLQAESLLRWFKYDFFTWVDRPECPICLSMENVSRVGMADPTDEDLSGEARRVELFSCSACGASMRFPRYNDPAVLLETRKGRCGEWANCFTLICRALGLRARYVWNAEDHVWTEIYLNGRWIHCDSCEAAFDQPLLYTHGWKKKMSYCIAFSPHIVRDVTARYVRDAEHDGLPRDRCGERELQLHLQEMQKELRQQLSAEEQNRLHVEDLIEEAELASYRIEAVELPSRTTGSSEWILQRGEAGVET